MNYTRLILLERLRSPGYVIPTVGFPAMFFGLFAVPYARTPQIANFELLSYVAFAIVGVTLFQFGVGVANERGRPWERYMRTLPSSAWARLGSRLVAALVFGLASAAFVAIAARIFTPIDLTFTQWLLLAVYAIVGGIPFVLFGLAIGYWCSSRAALPVANVFYLLCSYAGGLWMPPQFLPRIAATISPYLPTRQFAELMWSVVHAGNAEHAVVILTVYSLFFAGVVSLGYRRDEKARYA